MCSHLASLNLAVPLNTPQLHHKTEKGRIYKQIKQLIGAIKQQRPPTSELVGFNLQNAEICFARV